MAFVIICQSIHGFSIYICKTILSWLMVITLQVETLITAITSTMDESKKVERELVAIQERQVGEDDTNSGCLKIPQSHVSVLVSFG